MSDRLLELLTHPRDGVGDRGLAQYSARTVQREHLASGEFNAAALHLGIEVFERLCLDFAGCCRGGDGVAVADSAIVGWSLKRTRQLPSMVVQCWVGPAFGSRPNVRRPDGLWPRRDRRRRGGATSWADLLLPDRLAERWLWRALTITRKVSVRSRRASGLPAASNQAKRLWAQVALTVGHRIHTSAAAWRSASSAA